MAYIEAMMNETQIQMGRWAAEIGSRAKTWRGQAAAIRRHIALKPVRDPVAGNGRRAENRSEISCGDWLPELTSIRVSSIAATRDAWHCWRRIARCLRNGKYRELDPRSIPGQTTFFRIDQPRRIDRCFVFPGDLTPKIRGHGADFRWRGQWKTAPGSYIPACWIASCREANLTAYLAAPGRIGHPAALWYECARYDPRRASTAAGAGRAQRGSRPAWRFRCRRICAGTGTTPTSTETPPKPAPPRSSASGASWRNRGGSAGNRVGRSAPPACWLASGAEPWSAPRMCVRWELAGPASRLGAGPTASIPTPPCRWRSSPATTMQRHGHCG